MSSNGKQNSFIERLNNMSTEELHAILQRTAEGDRTHRANWFKQTNHGFEAVSIFNENRETYLAASQEV